MADLTWIFTLFCLAGSHLFLASPVLRSAQVVQVGHNASLTCNLTSTSEITWFLLRSDQLLPLLTLRRSLSQDTVDNHTADTHRFNTNGNLEKGQVRLEILEVEQEDAGLYFCTGRCTTPGQRVAAVCVNGGTYLTVTGADGKTARENRKQPCWNLGICVLPGLLALFFLLIVGFYLCSGKPAVCNCTSARRDSALSVTEDVHYSSLKHPDKPRPSVRGRTQLVKEDVTYSTVAGQKNQKQSRDNRSE